jgi:ribosomal subunit interface protein
MGRRMKIPLQITFKDLDPSDAIEASIRKHAERLDRFHDRITSCSVVIEQPQRRQRKGKLYRLRLDMTLPGHEIVVNRDPGLDHAHEDVYVAIRDAFDAATRQLEDYARRSRGDVKKHEVVPHGKIRMLDPAEGYGFIETTDGQDVYFHRNSVVDGGYPALCVGDEVRCVIRDREGEKGPQASTVIPIGKHHLFEPKGSRH